ncbi:MAG TPA: universal stress protein [Streptosporangiaceae bacterium]
MSTDPAPVNLYLVVGYDGSAPATRALDAAVRLLQGRAGRIEVLYVAHLPSADSLSADAIGELRADFDDIARELRANAGDQLRGHEVQWEFSWREGQIADQLMAYATGLGDAHPGATTVIVVGSSSAAMHRIVGSAAVTLARRSPVPVVVVP